MIAIIDYNAGNIRSVCNALRRLDASFELTADPERIRRADHVILPGVGEASSAMAELSGPLAELIPTLTQPVLGICIGIQLMSAFSEEGDVPCLGIFSPSVRRFVPAAGVKIPQMGWNTVEGLRGPLFKNIPEGSYVYYVHSFYPEYVEGETVACTSYAGVKFSAALARDNFFGTQFHPEKSGPVGARILKNFLEM